MCKKRALFSLIFICVLITGFLPSVVTLAAEPEYMGAEGCGECHQEEYESWVETDHANSAGIHEVNESGTWYWVAFPSRVMSEEDFLASCASCHVVNWDPETKSWPEKETDPGKFLNIQCEICHGPGFETMEVDYATESCSKCHNQPKDHSKSRHSESLEDLLESDHASDDCLHCMSTQGFIGKEVTLETEDLTSLSCASCHDPHSAENHYQLRYETSTQLCGECHTGSHHPQSEMYSDGPHAKADLECTSCHGQGTRIFHGEEDTWFNHTFGIYNTFYPYNQSEPMVCSNCHELTWATEQLDVIEQLTASFIENATSVVEGAQTIITDANATGVSQSKIQEAMAKLEEADSLVSYISGDGSGGLHNPEKSYAKLSQAAHLARDAQVSALDAKAEVLKDDVSSLQSEVSSLETERTELSNKVDKLQSQTPTNIGIGAIIGVVIGAVIVFFLKRYL